MAHLTRQKIKKNIKTYSMEFDAQDKLMLTKVCLLLLTLSHCDSPIHRAIPL